MADERFKNVTQLRLSDRQYRYLQLIAADNGDYKYAPVVRDLIDAAIANMPREQRKQLDLPSEEFSILLGELLGAV
jgi:hypothetical protein